MRQKEGQLDDRIKKYCDDNKLFYLKTIGRGYPDCIICANGQFVAFETKIGNNDTSVLQDYNIDKIKKAGGSVYKIYDYDIAAEILNNILRK